MSWRKWAYAGAIVFSLASAIIGSTVRMMPGEIGRWLRLAGGIGIGLPPLLVGLDMIIAPEKMPFQDFKIRRWDRDIRWWRYVYPSPEDTRSMGCLMLVFGALALWATVRQWQADLVYGP